MNGLLLIGMMVGLLGRVSSLSEEAAMTNICDLTMQDIDGKEVSLATYKGKGSLIVNVASKCGFTGRYEGLKTYEAQRQRTRHGDRSNAQCVSLAAFL